MQLSLHLMDFLGHVQNNIQDSIAQWYFFQEVFDFLDNEIKAFTQNVVGNMLRLTSVVALVLLTVWILYQGFMILTGRSRESMMGLVVSTLRALLIVIAASTLAFGSARIYNGIANKMPSSINEMVNGKYELPARNIDDVMTKMQIAMGVIDAIPALDNSSNKTDKDRAVMLTGLGAAGPSVVGGAMMLMYKMAIAMFIAFGPLFILSLLFDQTKSLFSKWLYYGIGTMFAMAVLNFMATVAMKMVVAVTAALATQAGLAMALGGNAPSISSMAMQQGGLGMILTILLVTIPPMAAGFFNGMLGQFQAYSAMGTVGARGGRDGAGRGPGDPGYNDNTPTPRNRSRDGGRRDEGSRNPGEQYATKG